MSLSDSPQISWSLISIRIKLTKRRTDKGMSRGSDEERRREEGRAYRKGRDRDIKEVPDVEGASFSTVYPSFPQSGSPSLRQVCS